MTYMSSEARRPAVERPDDELFALKIQDMTTRCMDPDDGYLWTSESFSPLRTAATKRSRIGPGNANSRIRFAPSDMATP